MVNFLYFNREIAIIDANDDMECAIVDAEDEH